MALTVFVKISTKGEILAYIQTHFLQLCFQMIQNDFERREYRNSKSKFLQKHKVLWEFKEINKKISLTCYIYICDCVDYIIEVNTKKSLFERKHVWANFRERVKMLCW